MTNSPKTMLFSIILLIHIQSSLTTCLENCKICASTLNTCTSCMDDYFITTTGTCQKCPKGCYNCKSDTECPTCYPGFFKSGSTCEECQNGCETCTTLTSCDACFEGFISNPSQTDLCLNCDVSHCQTCSAPKKCTKCVKGYFSNSKDECVSCIDEYSGACNDCDQLTCNDCGKSFTFSRGKCREAYVEGIIRSFALLAVCCCCICCCIGCILCAVFMLKSEKEKPANDNNSESMEPGKSKKIMLMDMDNKKLGKQEESKNSNKLEQSKL